MATHQFQEQSNHGSGELIMHCPKSYSIKQFIYARQNNVYMLLKTIQSEEHDGKDIDKLVYGIWRENCRVSIIIALIRLIVGFFYCTDCDNIDEMTNYNSISLMPIIRSVLHAGINFFHSDIKFGWELKNNAIYEYTFRINYRRQQLIVGLVNESKYFDEKWWATCDKGLGLDLCSGHFVTNIGVTQLLSRSQYIHCSKTGDVIIKMRINRKNQTVRYFNDTLQLGIAYHLEKNDTYCVAATLTAMNQEIRLIDSKQLKTDNSELTTRDKCISLLPSVSQRLEHQHVKNDCYCITMHAQDL